MQIRNKCNKNTTKTQKNNACLKTHHINNAKSDFRKGNEAVKETFSKLWEKILPVIPMVVLLEKGMLDTGCYEYWLCYRSFKHKSGICGEKLGTERMLLQYLYSQFKPRDNDVGDNSWKTCMWNSWVDHGIHVKLQEVCRLHVIKVCYIGYVLQLPMCSSVSKPFILYHQCSCCLLHSVRVDGQNHKRWGLAKERI